MQINEVASSWSKSGELVEATHDVSLTVMHKYATTSTDPLINRLVDNMHELLCIRARQISFSSFNCDAYDANDINNCIVRLL